MSSWSYGQRSKVLKRGRRTDVKEKPRDSGTGNGVRGTNVLAAGYQLGTCPFRNFASYEGAKYLTPFGTLLEGAS